MLRVLWAQTPHTGRGQSRSTDGLHGFPERACRAMVLVGRKELTKFGDLLLAPAAG